MKWLENEYLMTIIMTIIISSFLVIGIFRVASCAEKTKPAHTHTR